MHYVKPHSSFNGRVRRDMLEFVRNNSRDQPLANVAELTSTNNANTSTIGSVSAENSTHCKNSPFVVYADSASDERRVIWFTVVVAQGFYATGHFRFCASIPPSFPFEAPVIQSLQSVFHPNFDLATNQIYIPVDWSPVITLSSYVYALALLFLEPSDDVIWNTEAQQILRRDSVLFRQCVQQTLLGGQVGPVHFVRCVGWCSEHARCICGSGVNLNANVNVNANAERPSPRPAYCASTSANVAAATVNVPVSAAHPTAVHPPDQLQSTLNRAVAIAASTCYSSTAAPSASLAGLGLGPGLGPWPPGSGGLSQPSRSASKRPLSLPCEEDMEEGSEADEETSDGVGSVASAAQSHWDRGTSGRRMDGDVSRSPTGFNQCLFSGDIPLANLSLQGGGQLVARDTQSVLGASWGREAAGSGGSLGVTRQNSGNGHKAMRVAEQHDGSDRGLGVGMGMGMGMDVGSNLDLGSAAPSSSSAAVAAASIAATRCRSVGQESEGSAVATFS